MEIHETIIEYYELQDGEMFCIQQREIDSDEEELLDQICMTREVAVELAIDILRMMGNV